jgi:hypothetical protein
MFGVGVQRCEENAHGMLIDQKDDDAMRAVALPQGREETKALKV